MQIKKDQVQRQKASMRLLSALPDSVYLSRWEAGEKQKVGHPAAHEAEILTSVELPSGVTACCNYLGRQALSLPCHRIS